MDIIREQEIDPSPLAGKRVAILGFGNQGRAQALNLKDSGVDVVVGLRDGSATAGAVRAAGLQTAPLAQAAASADLAMFLAPDETLGELYGEVQPQIRQGAAIGFSHGLAVHFGMIEPRTDLDVILLAPKGPGSALRSLYEAGKGMIAVWAVGRDSSGKARELALAYGRAIGCARAGLIASSFAEEAEADLFNENAVVWGAVPEILQAGFETLVEAGYSPELAFLECIGELKLLAELIEERGIAGMREATSNTAELGALLGGPRIVDQGIRERMRDLLADIRRGDFAEELQRERESGYARLERARAEARAHQLQEMFERLQGLSKKP